MLIDAFEKLTSGRPVSRIDFATSHVQCGPPGMRVGFAGDDEFVDVWICHDETGMWLASNAHQHGPEGYRGLQGFDEPLSAVRRVWFADE